MVSCPSLPLLFRRLVPALSVFILAPATVRASELAELLPRNSVLFAEIRSVNKLTKAGDQPLVRSLSEAGFGKLIASLPLFTDPLAADKFRSETGYFPSELMSRLSGGVAMGIAEESGGGQPAVESAPAADKGGGKAGPDDSSTDGDSGGVLFVADFSGDEALLEKIFRALAKAKTAPGSGSCSASLPPAARLPEAVWPGDFAEKISYVEGVKVHQWNLLAPTLNRGKAMGWAFAGGKVFLSLGEGVLDGAVRRQVKKITNEGLSTTAMYQEVEAAAGTWDLLAGMDLPKVLHFGRKAAYRMLKEAGKAVNFNQTLSNPLARAGLEGLRYEFLSVDIQQQMIDILAGVTYTAKPDLFGVYAANGPGAEPLFAPFSARQVLWGAMDWTKGLGSLKQLVSSLTPGRRDIQVEQYLAMFFGMTGVDLEKDLLGRMGNEWWVMTRPDEAKENPRPTSSGATSPPPDAGHGSTVLGISLRDRAGLETSLNKIITALSAKQRLFSERQRNGVTIHDFLDAPAGCPVSWLIKNDTLLLSLGPPALLEDVLSGMARRPTATPLDQAAVKAAFSRMPGGHSAAGFATMESLAISTLTVL